MIDGKRGNLTGDRKLAVFALFGGAFGHRLANSEWDFAHSSSTSCGAKCFNRCKATRASNFSIVRC